MLELLGDGLEIAVFGMLVVFLLLGCLVLLTEAVSRLAVALVPSTGIDAGRDSELTVAIAAAIHMHRRRRR